MLTIAVIFPFLWVALFVGLWFFASSRPQIDVRQLLLYVAFMAMIGPVGEVFVGTLYEALVGVPLWQYKILPIHHGYTSLYAPVIWGISGVSLYYLNDIRRVWSHKSKVQKAALSMVETITLEAALNVSFLLLSGSLIFYYTPGDLWHVTSLQTLPFYFGLGFIIQSSIKRMRKDTLFFAAMCGLLTLVFVYFL